jgi:hypothetical protein
MGIWDTGERVVDVIGRTAPQCIVSELVTTFLRTGSPSEASRRESASAALMRPPVAMVNQAVVGGIAIGLLDLAHHHIIERAHGRNTSLDEDAIRRQALVGVADGARELHAALGEGASRLAALGDELSKRRDDNELGHIPIQGDAVDQGGV